MLIRDMTAADVGAVMEIERASFSDPWTENMFLNDLAQEIAVYRVAVEDGRPVGYMGMYHVADEGHITNIAVLPVWRGRGVASALLQSFVELALSRRLVFLTLEVRAGNSGAIRLYEKFGFRQVGVRPKYYEHTEDALLMTRTFGQGVE